MQLIVALLPFTFLVSASQLPPYEPNPELRASEILSAELLRSEDHSVAEAVPNDGFFNHYVVETPFGDFEAEGNRQLNLRVQEAHALAELDRFSNTDLFIDAGKRVVMAPVQAVDRFVDAPAETVKGIPGGIARKFRSLGRAVKSGAEKVMEDDESGEAEGGCETEVAEGQAEEACASEGEGESKSKNYALKWFGVTGAERRWAQKLGVDPYSSNTVLREKVSAVAKVDAAASFGARLAMPSLGAVGYVVTISNLVWNLDGEELRAYNLTQLAEAGIPDIAISEFLDNPVFSPTLQTVIVQSMVEMKNVEGLERVLTLEGWVESETEALFYTESILLMAQFHRSVHPVRAIVGESLVPAMVTGSDELIYVVAVDYLTWNVTLVDLIQGPMAVGIPGVQGGHKLMLNGKATETVTAGLSILGWSVEAGISLD